jgi:hypothetical protein
MRIHNTDCECSSFFPSLFLSGSVPYSSDLGNSVSGNGIFLSLAEKAHQKNLVSDPSCFDFPDPGSFLLNEKENLRGEKILKYCSFVMKMTYSW